MLQQYKLFFVCFIRAEEMCAMVEEVSEKVNFIQHSMTELDSQLGQLQDLSALAVDTLTLLSASDNLCQEEARLAHCRLVTASHRTLPHSWTYLHRSGTDSEGSNLQRMVMKSCKSTPPSLLKCSALMVGRGGKEEKHEQSESGQETANEVLFFL